MGKVCQKCKYERTLSDKGPMEVCPNCGAIYTKVEEFLKRRRTQEAAPAQSSKPRQEGYPTRVKSRVRRQESPSIASRSKDVSKKEKVSPPSSNLTSVLYVLAFLSLVGGMILAFNSHGFLSVVWLMTGFVEAVIFAVFGQAIEYLKGIYENTLPS